MPAKNKSSMTTKLTGFVIVAAIIVFGAKNQKRITEQIQKTRSPLSAIPVDRNLLSQRLLPSLRDFNNIDASENTSLLSTAPVDETRTKSNQESLQTGPSLYELKLEDQKAWRSQPRRAGLGSTRQPVGSSEMVATSSSESPIVPGHVDPHLWYESQHMELASLEVQQLDQLIASDSDEFTELPELSPQDTLSAIVQPQPIPLETAAAKPVPAPSVGVSRAWETGRY